MANKLFGEDFLKNLVIEYKTDSRNGLVGSMTRIYDQRSGREFTEAEYDKIFNQIMKVRERRAEASK